MSSNRQTLPWLVDIFVGGLLGGIVGAIVAVNFVIFIGTEKGYESSIAEVFEFNVFAGSVTLLILIMGPIAGVWLARRRRRQS